MTEWSGIPAAIGFLGPSVTYEGDNSVMAQQSFRYLKKVFKKMNNPKEKEFKDHSYLNYLRDVKSLLHTKCTATSEQDFTDLEQVD